MPHSIELHGFEILPALLSPEETAALTETLGPEADGAGNRGALAHPAVAALAQSERLLDMVRPHLPDRPLAVRALLFNKSPDANWLVPWHQDLTLTLREKRDTPGFGPWSVKDGIPHVQPPAELLEQMLTVRLHLDDTAADNGALRVIPGSHAAGRLSAAHIQEWRTGNPEVLCAVPAGGALLMRPLLLHASARSTSLRPRRVLHLEFAGFPLPEGLHWQAAAGS